MSKKALEDVTVLDLTRVLAGPYCTVTLADFGANVIKIEIPRKGDDTRSYGPMKNGESLYFANVNHDKKGITLNLKSEEGKKIFLELVKKADVVVENYRPGVMDKLGLGYETLREINERIIYAAVSGFGCYGPYSARPGYDIIAQATGGLISITGEENGTPVRVGNAMGDILGGLNLTIGILTALHARTLTGKGQRVDVSLVDSVVSSLETATQRYFASGEDPKPIGNRYAAAYPYDSFKAKDGRFVIGCGNDHLYQLLCEKVLQRPDLISDERFDTLEKRNLNHVQLKPEIDKWAAEHTVNEAVQAITQAGVPAAPVNTVSCVTKDPHIAEAREMFVTVKHPIIGEMKVNGCPVKLLDTMPEIVSPSPALGQDNADVYGSMLGITEEQLQDMYASGVI